MRGVVAAGHPLTAEAGARILRDGGNAVDAAVGAVLMSFVAESPLTGPGAGGFMLLHTASGEDHLLDFFVGAPGRGLERLEPAALTPIRIHWHDDAFQLFNIGPSSCGVYGTPKGLAEALRRFGSMPLSALVGAPARAAREGVAVSQVQEYLFQILDPIMAAEPEGRAIYQVDGRPVRAGDVIRLPEVGDLLDRLGAEGPDFLYTGDVAAAVSDWVLERGGLLTREDLATYEVVEREPARARYRGREVITNPPPSSGGILIAYALDLLERLGPPRRRARAGGGDGQREPGAHRRVRARTALGGLPRAIPGEGGDRVGGRRAALAARLHHARGGARRGRRLRQRDLLERLLLRCDRARHRHPPEQHARRAGPEPAAATTATRRAAGSRA